MNKKYFLGNAVSDYGVSNGFVDYATLAKSFNHVLCNDITTLFYSTINDEYIEPEIFSGWYGLYENTETGSCIPEYEYNELDETEQNNYTCLGSTEIFQYYIISEQGANILKEYTHETVFYIEPLNLYVWGVTHWGTSWDYVLTDIEL